MTHCSVKTLQEKDTEPQLGPHGPVTFPHGHGLRDHSVCGSQSAAPITETPDKGLRQIPLHLRVLTAPRTLCPLQAKEVIPKLHHSRASASAMHEGGEGHTLASHVALCFQGAA